MSITKIFDEIMNASGHAKREILKRERNNTLLRDIIKATYESHWNYNVKITFDHPDDVKVEKDEDKEWKRLLQVLYDARDGKTKGNHTRNLITEVMAVVQKSTSEYMMHVVNRHMNIGCSTKTFNMIWPGLISTFECQLAEKFDSARISHLDFVAVEPKLDGVRCLAFVSSTGTKLFTRSGKQILNFDNVCSELSSLASSEEMVFDGELMSADFSAMMGQVFRKKDIDPSNVVYNVFDCMPRRMWDAKVCTLTCRSAREMLEDFGINIKCKHVRMIERHIVNPAALLSIHKEYVSRGIEGSMVKLLDTRYEWKRNWNVMKVKDFFSIDLPIASFTEGTGRYEGHLGAFIVYLNGVEVKIERGHMTKDEALHIWLNRNEYRGKMIEINYQEVTRDGSLRLPVFMRFRRDKETT